MMRWITTVAGLLAAALGGCASASGGAASVDTPVGPGSGWLGASSQPSPAPEAFLREASRPDARGRYVLVDLDRNELRVMDGERPLWSAPVGTGTGLYLRGRGREWDFSTPTGTFQVQYKQLDPIWVLPDWHFVKNDLPIPPAGSPERRVPGALGVAAIYLGDEIAIHGTDRPELLGQRISHGCIRLEDRYALRLFHNVQVGTPVVIVGGEAVSEEDVSAPTDPGAPGSSRASPLSGTSSEALLRRLDREIVAAHHSSDWTATASELIERGISDDATALRGLLQRAGLTINQAFEREYAAFLADAYARGAGRVVVSLARTTADARERAARAIVEATMDLYPGDPESPAAPWPSQRLRPDRLGPEGRTGWQAIRDAEADYRQDHAAARV